MYFAWWFFSRWWCHAWAHVEYGANITTVLTLDGTHITIHTIWVYEYWWSQCIHFSKMFYLTLVLSSKSHVAYCFITNGIIINRIKSSHVVIMASGGYGCWNGFQPSIPRRRRYATDSSWPIGCSVIEGSWYVGYRLEQACYCWLAVKGNTRLVCLC
jgi:hypothetical protein